MSGVPSLLGRLGLDVVGDGNCRGRGAVVDVGGVETSVTFCLGSWRSALTGELLSSLAGLLNF